jgi:hypothetical protein
LLSATLRAAPIPMPLATPEPIYSRSPVVKAVFISWLIDRTQKLRRADQLGLDFRQGQPLQSWLVLM